MIGMLCEVPLFAGLGEQQLEAMARCMTTRTFGKGVYIYHKDSPGRTLYIIQSGRVRLFVISDMGQEISVDSLGPGGVFGTLAVVDEQPHQTGAVAMEKTAVLMLPRADLLRGMDACPVLARNMMSLLTTRVRASMRYIEDLAFLDLHARVATRLLDLAARCGAKGSGGIELHLTQGELASWVVATRESVNKVLAALRTKGLIAVDGPRIIVFDLPGLQREVNH